MTITKRILFPTDFSEAAEAAERRAVELASAMQAELVLLHVMDDTPMMLGDGAGYLPAEAVAEYQKHAKRRLEHCAAHALAGNTRCRTLMLRGRPEQTIIEAAEREGADLIVMGTNGRQGFRRFMLGSVAERVVRTSKVPVLTVRYEEAKGAPAVAAMPPVRA